MTRIVALENWRAEALAAGGGDYRTTRFLCPLCGNVSTPSDFIAAGAEGERAAYECIGRVVGAKGNLRQDKPLAPCDWAAWGLFGELGKGVLVTMPDGREIAAFEFAT